MVGISTVSLIVVFITLVFVMDIVTVGGVKVARKYDAQSTLPEQVGTSLAKKAKEQNQTSRQLRNKKAPYLEGSCLGCIVLLLLLRFPPRLLKPEERNQTTSFRET